jgi:hypothetical protein
MTNGVTALLTLLVSLLAIRSARGFGYIEPGYLDGASCTMVSEPNYWCNDYISLSTDGTTTMVEDCVAQADALNVCPTNYISFAYNDNDGHSWCDCCGESWTPDSNDYGAPAPDETGGTYFCE